MRELALIFFRRQIAIASAAALGVPLVAGALEPEAFAVGWPLELPIAGDVVDVPLTREVYENIDGVEQIAILDAGGVPVSFFRISPGPGAVEQRARLSASPLFAAAADALAADVAISSAGDETRVRVVPGPGRADDALTGFLLDARAIDWPPSEIELEWEALERPFLIDVVVEQSTDLIGWRSVGRGSVAALHVGDAETRHARIAISAAPGGYYRIAASREVPGWTLESATLIGSTAEPVTTRTVLIPGAVMPGSGATPEIVFDVGGPLPTRSVSLDFGGGSGWLRGRLASAATLDGPWQRRAPSRLFYSVSFEGRTFTSEPVELGRLEDRFFKITLDDATRAAQIALEVEYAEERLRFAAEGRAPYLLAAGTRSPEAGPDPTFEAVWRTLAQQDETVPRAELGSMRVLGGAAAVTPVRAIPWTLVGLWVALAAGVLVVGAMAIRLGRELLTSADRR